MIRPLIMTVLMFGPGDPPSANPQTMTAFSRLSTAAQGDEAPIQHSAPRTNDNASDAEVPTVANFCTKSKASAWNKLKQDAPSNTGELLYAIKHAIDTELVADACFYDDLNLKAYFGASSVKHFFYKLRAQPTEEIQVARYQDDASDGRPMWFRIDIQLRFSPTTFDRVEINLNRNDLHGPFHGITEDAANRILGPGGIPSMAPSFDDQSTESLRFNTVLIGLRAVNTLDFTQDRPGMLDRDTVTIDLAT